MESKVPPTFAEIFRSIQLLRVNHLFCNALEPLNSSKRAISVVPPDKSLKGSLESQFPSEPDQEFSVWPPEMVHSCVDLGNTSTASSHLGTPVSRISGKP